MLVWKLLKIIESAKAEIKQELDVAIEKADADISVKASASEEAIAEIRKDALVNVKSVAKKILHLNWLRFLVAELTPKL